MNLYVLGAEKHELQIARINFPHDFIHRKSFVS